MTAANLIAECSRPEVELTRAGSTLKVNAPAGAIAPTRRAGLAEHKGAILALLALVHAQLLTGEWAHAVNVARPVCASAIATSAPDE